MGSADELTLVLTNTFENIPRELFEDSADEFLDDAAISRLYECDKFLNSTPYSMVFELRNDIGEVCGVMWIVVDPVLNALYCRFISVFKEYRDGSIATLVDRVMTDIAKHAGLDRLFGVTQKDTSYWQTYGWKLANTRMITKEVK